MAFLLKKRLYMVFFILLCFTGITGCATYHPMPISSQSINKMLIPPDMSKIKFPVKKFKAAQINQTGKRYEYFPYSSPPFNISDGLSPNEAAIFAIIANPKLRMVRDKQKIASAQLLQAGILPNPSFSYNIGIPADKDNKVNSFGLGFDWDIYSLILRTTRMDAAKAHISSINLDIAWQEWQVAENARLHACNLIFAEKRLGLTKSKKAVFQKMLSDMIKGVDFGVKTQLDFSTARTGMQEAELEVINAKAKVIGERMKLNRTIGFPPGKIIPMEKNILPVLGQIPPVKTLFKTALDSRLDLAAFRFGYKSQEARVRGAVRSWFPKINIGLTREKDTDGLTTTGFGLNIELPFFDHNQGHIAMERASRRQLFDEYTLRIFETRADITSLVLTIKAVRQRITGIDKALFSLKIFAESCSSAADAGSIDIFSCYKALENLFQRRIQKIDLEQKIVDLGIGLEIASGRYGLVRGK